MKEEIAVSGLLQESRDRGFWQHPAGEGRQDQPIRALFSRASPRLPSCLHHRLLGKRVGGPKGEGPVQ